MSFTDHIKPSDGLPDDRDGLLQLIKEAQALWDEKEQEGEMEYDKDGNPLGVPISISWIAAFLAGRPLAPFLLERYWHPVKGISVHRTYGGRGEDGPKDDESYSLEQIVSSPNPDGSYPGIVDLIRTPFVFWNRTIGRLGLKTSPPSILASLLVKSKTGTESILLEWVIDANIWQTVKEMSVTMKKGVDAHLKLKDKPTREEEAREQAEFELEVEKYKVEILEARAKARNGG